MNGHEFVRPFRAQSVSISVPHFHFAPAVAAAALDGHAVPCHSSSSCGVVIIQHVCIPDSGSIIGIRPSQVSLMIFLSHPDLASFSSSGVLRSFFPFASLHVIHCHRNT